MARTAFRRTIPLLVALPAALAAQQRAMEPNDWHRVSTVGSATIAPDGKRVAFTVTTIAERENRRHSEIWVVPTAGGTPQRYGSERRMTREAALEALLTSVPGEDLFVVTTGKASREVFEIREWIDDDGVEVSSEVVSVKEAAQAVAHTLKSGSAMLGARRVADACELMGRLHSTFELHQVAADVMRTSTAAARWLHDWLARQP